MLKLLLWGCAGAPSLGGRGFQNMKGKEADSPGACMEEGPCGHPELGPMRSISDFQNHRWFRCVVLRAVCGPVLWPQEQEERQDGEVKGSQRRPAPPSWGTGQSWIFLSSR